MSKIIYTGADGSQRGIEISERDKKVYTWVTRNHDRVLKMIHEWRRDGALSRNSLGETPMAWHASRVPPEIYTAWQQEYFGRGKFKVRRGNPPCQNVCWGTWLGEKMERFRKTHSQFNVVEGNL